MLNNSINASKAKLVLLFFQLFPRFNGHFHVSDRASTLHPGHPRRKQRRKISNALLAERKLKFFWRLGLALGQRRFFLLSSGARFFPVRRTGTLLGRSRRNTLHPTASDHRAV